MSQKTMRVLCLFDYACTTGFSTVSHNIIHHLRKHFGKNLILEIIGINYFGETFMEDSSTRVYPASKIDPKGDVYGRNEFGRMIRFADFDAIFIIQDVAILNMLGELYKLLRADRKKENKKIAKLIGYFPIDSPPLEGFLTHLDAYDTLVTYTEYGRNEICKMRPNWRQRIKVIPHGFNPEVFYPMKKDVVLRFRQEYFGDNSDKYIITNISRNQPRKDIPNTIFSFIEYKERFDPDAFLYLHMSHCDPLGWNLKSIMEQTWLKENRDYMFLADAIRDHGASSQMMNMIHNASDVYLTTTLGEGWGISITDSFATRLPVVAPLHTSIREIGADGQRCWGLEEFRPVVTTWDNIIRDQVDYREVAERIEECRKNIDETQKKIDYAHSYVQNLTWEKICERWISEFERLLK